MADVLYVVTVVAAFAALFGLVRVCDRLVGPDDDPAVITSSGDPGGVSR